MHPNPTNVEDRRLAEFTDQEIAELLRQDGFGQIVPRPGQDRIPAISGERPPDSQPYIDVFVHSRVQAKRLGMGLSVSDRGKAVATFRYVHVELMETLAQWTPTSPEMEVKLMLGEHIWDAAQNADALGKRTRELRLPLQHSLKPVDAYVHLLEEIRQERDTSRRLSGLYDAILPGLDARYHAYLEQNRRAPRRADGAYPRASPQHECPYDQAEPGACAELPALGNVDRGWIEAMKTAGISDPDARILDGSSDPGRFRCEPVRSRTDPGRAVCRQGALDRMRQLSRRASGTGG